jgi:hypothetical protein
MDGQRTPTAFCWQIPELIYVSQQLGKVAELLVAVDSCTIQGVLTSTTRAADSACCGFASPRLAYDQWRQTHPGTFITVLEEQIDSQQY